MSRVMTGLERLADKFFWTQDRMTQGPYQTAHKYQVPRQAGLARRKNATLGKLADELAGVVGADTEGLVPRLAKADLVSEIVFEFPEVQGSWANVREMMERMMPLPLRSEHYSQVRPMHIPQVR